MNKEFLGFLKQDGVIGLAIAVIIGGKGNAARRDGHQEVEAAYTIRDRSATRLCATLSSLIPPVRTVRT